MEEQLQNILESFNKKEIDIETALISIMDLFNDNNNYFHKECNCCYMTTGIHSKNCPKYLDININI